VRTSTIATSPRRCASSSISISLEIQHVARPDHPRHVGDVRVQALPHLEPLELAGEVVRLAAAEGVVVVAEVVVEAMDEKPRTCALLRVERQEGRLRVRLLEQLHDHLGLRQPVEHRDAPLRRVQVEEPLRPVREVDLDALDLHALLGERDAHARAVGTARRIDQPHGSRPISRAICS
jgi:hypothetical protein